MDNTQLITFIDYLTDGRTIGGSAEEPTETLHSPEMRAFIVARLGDAAPNNGYGVVTKRKRNEFYARQAKALAKLLREVADGIDPPPSDEGADELTT